jgi:hypothetical protein
MISVVGNPYGKVNTDYPVFGNLARVKRQPSVNCWKPIMLFLKKDQRTENDRPKTVLSSAPVHSSKPAGILNCLAG